MTTLDLPTPAWPATGWSASRPTEETQTRKEYALRPGGPLVPGVR